MTGDTSSTELGSVGAGGIVDRSRSRRPRQAGPRLEMAKLWGLVLNSPVEKGLRQHMHGTSAGCNNCASFIQDNFLTFQYHESCTPLRTSISLSKLILESRFGNVIITSPFPICSCVLALLVVLVLQYWSILQFRVQRDLTVEVQILFECRGFYMYEKCCCKLVLYYIILWTTKEYSSTVQVLYSRLFSFLQFCTWYSNNYCISTFFPLK
jgi:hypothetical protein